MKCYICEKTPGPGGTHYHVHEAIGICHNCGIAVCMQHSFKSSEPGSPLLCPGCEGLLARRKNVPMPNVERRF